MSQVKKVNLDTDVRLVVWTLLVLSGKDQTSLSKGKLVSGSGGLERGHTRHT